MGDLPDRVRSLEIQFPKIKGRYTVTSERTPDYNCFAFAADASETAIRWSPGASGLGGEYWPEGVARAVTLDAFIQAYATVGYRPCPDGDLEPDLEKIAIYGVRGIPRHAARQLPSGSWTSKMGDIEDIEHTLESIEGEQYGTVIQFLSRPRART